MTLLFASRTLVAKLRSMKVKSVEVKQGFWKEFISNVTCEVESVILEVLKCVTYFY